MLSLNLDKSDFKINEIYPDVFLIEKKINESKIILKKKFFTLMVFSHFYSNVILI